jgi:hypothetical protein
MIGSDEGRDGFRSLSEPDFPGGSGNWSQ